MPEVQVRSSHAPTIFVDLDGVLVKHQGPPWGEQMELNTGVRDTLRQLWNIGSHIVITTGRPECLRTQTEFQFRRLGIYYHQLVMGLTSGTRYLVNDTKPYAEERCTAFAVNVKRDTGLKFEDLILRERPL